MTLNGYDWCTMLIIEDWDFRVVFINATREYESTVFYYSSYILWQNLVPCMLYTFTILYQRSK